MATIPAIGTIVMAARAAREADVGGDAPAAGGGNEAPAAPELDPDERGGIELPDGTERGDDSGGSDAPERCPLERGLGVPT